MITTGQNCSDYLISSAGIVPTSWQRDVLLALNTTVIFGRWGCQRLLTSPCCRSHRRISACLIVSIAGEVVEQSLSTLEESLSSQPVGSFSYTADDPGLFRTSATHHFSSYPTWLMTSIAADFMRCTYIYPTVTRNIYDTFSKIECVIQPRWLEVYVVAFS